MLFSFEHSIEPKDHKSEEECKVIAVKGAIWPKLYWSPRTGWLSPARQRSTILKFEMLQLCMFVMPLHQLIIENVCNDEKYT